MKRSGGTITLLCALLAGTAGCATAGDTADTAASRAVDDSRITAGVKNAIAADPVLRNAEIDVATSLGVVQLSGFVSSAEDVATAAAVARTVTGVKSVRNDLRLK